MENNQQRHTGWLEWWVLIVAIIMAPISLWAGKPKVLDTSKYPRVAVLVCRMAGQNGLLSDIQPETDYRLRVLGKRRRTIGSHLSFRTIGSHLSFWQLNLEGPSLSLRSLPAVA